MKRKESEALAYMPRVPFDGKNVHIVYMNRIVAAFMFIAFLCSYFGFNYQSFNEIKLTAPN